MRRKRERKGKRERERETAAALKEKNENSLKLRAPECGPECCLCVCEEKKDFQVKNANGNFKRVFYSDKRVTVHVLSSTIEMKIVTLKANPKSAKMSCKN